MGFKRDLEHEYSKMYEELKHEENKRYLEVEHKVIEKAKQLVEAKYDTKMKEMEHNFTIMLQRLWSLPREHGNVQVSRRLVPNVSQVTTTPYVPAYPRIGLNVSPPIPAWIPGCGWQHMQLVQMSHGMCLVSMTLPPESYTPQPDDSQRSRWGSHSANNNEFNPSGGPGGARG